MSPLALRVICGMREIEGPHGCRLDFESSDPRHTVKVYVRDMRKDNPIISIGGVVVSVYRPLMLTR